MHCYKVKSKSLIPRVCRRCWLRGAVLSFGAFGYSPGPISFASDALEFVLSLGYLAKQDQLALPLSPQNLSVSELLGL